ncbi:MAG: hypothetical protein M5R36_21080 [Deltaproteobacteria bacterium]|nr:hypothetical protein [Deltaproteobacteria bacterium]
MIGAVYYSVVETATHAFVVYSVFHPVNYGLFIDDSLEAVDNDMTGLMVVVDKHRPDAPPLLVETYANGQFLHYTSDPEVRHGSERIDGDLLAEDNTHPRVFIEAGRHGCLVTSDYVIGEYVGQPDQDFLGGSGLVYRFSRASGGTGAR